MSGTNVNLSSPVLFYQNPIDIYQTQDGSTDVTGHPSEIYSCRSCDTNLAGNNPASQYQRQKLIQNTVRVMSSLYTMNLAGLSGYQKPLSRWQLIEQAGSFYSAPPSVYWNQMSDRAEPAKQIAKTASGSTYHSSSTRHTITRQRPGALSPGGLGVDIKHNSYERYLNKLKGKGPLRRGVVPPDFGRPIPFNRAYPVYGGKTVKTAIINGCDCPDVTNNIAADIRIYGSPLNALQEQILSVTYKFNVGDFVWARKQISDTKMLYKAEIIAIVNGIYTIKFVDDGTTENVVYSQLLIYFDCDCPSTLSIYEEILANRYDVNKLLDLANTEAEFACNVLTDLSATTLL
jgi:hypothetical protein